MSRGKGGRLGVDKGRLHYAVGGLLRDGVACDEVTSRHLGRRVVESLCRFQVAAGRDL